MKNWKTKNWLVDVRQEHPLLSEFKEWIQLKIEDILHFSERYYGYNKNAWECFLEVPSHFELITLEEWKEMVFPIETWNPKQGELVEGKVCLDFWVKTTFIAEYKGVFICFHELDKEVTMFDEIRKYSPLQDKIDELKKLAEEQGLKITINVE